ncbi:nitric oxide synthase, inducible-like [Clytia hemisphaerica]|uniref:Nitric oxide synthase n=1 Tax=Clytia hemisphaerica TaxID=252671 RepID=A0A7M5UAZ7_9CNID|eukprot:TCONS_00019533-protein
MQEIKLYHHAEGHFLKDRLHKQATDAQCGRDSYCTGALVQPPVCEKRAYGELRPVTELKQDAMNFFKEFFKDNSNNLQEDKEALRMCEVMRSIEETGTYELTEQELAFGAKLAWRNAPRCIARKQWNSLKLFDFRHCQSAEEIFQRCLQHIQYATNGGLIRSTISIFKKRTENNKETRIWNSQLIKYAGYTQPDGSVIGDPNSCEFTEVCKTLGWQGKGGAFDVLPIVIQYKGGEPEFFEIPEEYILRVKISHPKYPKLANLGLEWYAVAIISDMSFDCGGQEFTCAPFNGWYTPHEIGVRNFMDKQRYDMIKPIAEAFDLDTSDNLTLWKDKAAIEMTYAVLYSFKKFRVTISDHHSLSEQFCEFMKSETNSRGGCPADWVWIVPSISGSLLPVFHQEMINYKLKPSYEYQDNPWRHHRVQKRKFTNLKEISKFVLICIKMAFQYLRKRPQLTVLYGSESGNAKRFARHLENTVNMTFWTKFSSLNKYEFVLDSTKPQFLAIVTSTFGNGEAPSNAELFDIKLKKMVIKSELNRTQEDINQSKPLQHYKYTVFALGSSAYPQFCAFGNDVNNKMRSLGAEEIYGIGEGDELNGQEQSFLNWLGDCYIESCNRFDIIPTFGTDMADTYNNNLLSSEKKDKFLMDGRRSQWSESKFRIVRADTERKQIKSLCNQISETNRLNVAPSKVIDVENLQTNQSRRKTNFIRLSIQESHKQLQYEIGDSLAIFPENDHTLVERVLKKCRSSFDLDEPIKLEINLNHDKKNDTDSWVSHDRISSPTTLATIFESLLDLNSPPTQSFLSLLCSKATHPNDINTLQNLIQNEMEYKQWRNYNCPTIADVLDKFSSVQISVTFLITQLPLLKPRYYSISSSPRCHPNEIHLTVALLEYKTQGRDGMTRKGVCSSWLDNLKPDDIVPCFVKKSNRMRIPETSDPLILVGPGTGIAPFRGFWQELEYKSKHQHNGTKLPEVVLYTGCRSPQEDFLFQEEIQRCHESGVLNKVHSAFSRVHGKAKNYVQHLMKQNAREMYDLLCKRNGHLFVCGGIEMAKDVKESIVEIIQECSQIDYVDALEATENLKLNGFYHEEVFAHTI